MLDTEYVNAGHFHVTWYPDGVRCSRCNGLVCRAELSAATVVQHMKHGNGNFYKGPQHGSQALLCHGPDQKMHFRPQAAACRATIQKQPQTTTISW